MDDADEFSSKESVRASARTAIWPQDLETIRGLFKDYRRWIADHQDPAPSAAPRVKAGLAVVDSLVDGLPENYTPPAGDVLLWFEKGALVACGALRRLDPEGAEAKRIFVRADYRGMEFGPVFVRALMKRARELGFRRLRVDTLPSMSAAIEFYGQLGFRPIAAFWPHPAPGALFFEKDLSEPPTGT